MAASFFFVVAYLLAPDNADVENSWGRTQLNAMLAARPNMSKFRTKEGKERFISELDEIWRYAADRFGGAGLPDRVVWGGDLPSGNDQFNAMHQTPDYGRSAVIYLRRLDLTEQRYPRPLSFEELWFYLTYEFFNMENTDAYLALERQALDRQIDRNTWIIKATRLEHAAMLRTVIFYQDVWLPWASRNAFDSDPRIWRTCTPKSFDEFISLYSADSNGYPWSIWGHLYDVRIAPQIGSNLPRRKADRTIDP